VALRVCAFGFSTVFIDTDGESPAIETGLCFFFLLRLTSTLGSILCCQQVTLARNPEGCSSTDSLDAPFNPSSPIGVKSLEDFRLRDTEEDDLDLFSLIPFYRLRKDAHIKLTVSINPQWIYLNNQYLVYIRNIIFFENACIYLNFPE
jgi:hypothetical protein